MDVLQDVRMVEKEWARRFSGKREAPRLGLGQSQFRVSWDLNRFACAMERLAYVVARTVDTGLVRLMPLHEYKTLHRSRTASCVYRE
jgi:hypothetical protein